MRDVIVIGAGGGGAVVAKELAARGLDVLLLEAGPRNLRPAEAWSRLENDANNAVSGYFRFGSGDRSRSPWVRETPQSSFVWQVSGVGGTTQPYYGNSPRAQPGVFSGYRGGDRDAYDRAHEFPFGYRHLIPYYEWVEHTLPVQTAAMGRKELVFLRGARRIGLPALRSKDVTRASHRPQENAILQPRGTAGKTRDPSRLSYPEARGCTFCGFCPQGCVEPRGAPRNLAAKRSTDASYVPMALTADSWMRGGGPVTLIADAFATGIGTATEGGDTVARAVTWRIGESGETVTEEARVVVMAGGGVETPRLWLNSALPDPNGWVGRGFTDHYLDWLVAKMPFRTASSAGPSSAARCDFPGRGGLENIGLAPSLQAFAAALSDAGTNTVGPGGQGRLVGNALKSLLEDVDRLFNVMVITDDDVQPQNRVTLSSFFPADEHGPVPKIEFDYRRRTARTLRNHEFLVAKAVELARAAGASEIYHLRLPQLILHPQSTMRMGADAANSVLDPNCEARFVKRLFVADNSALPNALGGPNPTLTTQALATRTAESIFRLYFGGDPWVRRESPVRSIDRRVTKAVVEREL